MHNSYRQGGGEDAVANSDAALLRAAGHEVFEYRTSNPPTPMKSVGTVLLSPWNPRSARDVGQIVDDFRPDIVHVHNTWYRLSPSVFRTIQKRRVPIVVTVHNYRLICPNAVLYRDGAPCTDCVGTHPWRSVVHRCYRNSLFASAAVASDISINRAIGTWATQVNRFIVATDFLGDALARSGIPRDRIIRLPLAVSDPGIRPDSPSRSKSVLLVSRLDAEKGTGELLRLWAQVDNGLELVIIGDGADRVALEKMRVPRVRFSGWMKPESVVSEMLAARALVFPSVLYETFGLSIVEAFAAGLPVVANNTGTRPEVIGTQGAGWLVSDADGWRSALSDMGSDAAIDRSGSLARRRYESLFSPKVLVPQLEELYREVVELHRIEIMGSNQNP